MPWPVGDGVVMVCCSALTRDSSWFESPVGNPIPLVVSMLIWNWHDFMLGIQIAISVLVKQPSSEGSIDSLTSGWFLLVKEL